MNDILEFDGEHRWLSNFWPAEVVLDGVKYPTTENAYQAAKTIDPVIRKQFVNCTPGMAKKLGQVIAIRNDWEQIKIDVMTELLKQKFAINTEFGQKLLNTHNVKIVEGNYWHDTFWGVCNGVGKNMLGKIIMNIRRDLKFDDVIAF
jgi:ribA/ribD-fused uncharacterized protein